MASRQFINHTVSTTAPVIGTVGDEWFNPSTNTLSKVVVTNGVSVGWSTVGSTLGSVSSVKITGGASGQALITDGSGNLSFGSAGAGITDNTTTNANTFYPTLANTTSGGFTTATISSTKLFFNPSTGTLNSTIFNSLSDKSVKTNLQKITNALEKLKLLGGYTYLLVDSNEPSAGLLAQEAQQALPEATKFNPDTGLLSLNYNAILGLVVEGLNELETRVSRLENNA